MGLWTSLYSNLRACGIPLLPSVVARYAVAENIADIKQNIAHLVQEHERCIDEKSRAMENVGRLTDARESEIQAERGDVILEEAPQPREPLSETTAAKIELIKEKYRPRIFVEAKKIEDATREAARIMDDLEYMYKLDRDMTIVSGYSTSFENKMRILSEAEKKEHLHHHLHVNTAYHDT